MAYVCPDLTRGIFMVILYDAIRKQPIQFSVEQKKRKRRWWAAILNLQLSEEDSLNHVAATRSVVSSLIDTMFKTWVVLGTSAYWTISAAHTWLVEVRTASLIEMHRGATNTRQVQISLSSSVQNRSAASDDWTVHIHVGVRSATISLYLVCLIFYRDLYFDNDTRMLKRYRTDGRIHSGVHSVKLRGQGSRSACLYRFSPRHCTAFWNGFEKLL